LGKGILLVSLFLVASINVYAEYSFNTVTTTIDFTTPDQATLHVVVTDKTTTEAIENAIVYIGAGGALKQYTDGEGACIISDLLRGSYGVGVFRKEYHRFTESRQFVVGDNYLTVELERRDEIPESFTIEGKVIEIITSEGSRSENHYFKVRDDSGKEEYIFNDIGLNRDFSQFVNEEVRITGFRDIGYIGWEYDKAEGIYVEEIEVRNNQNELTQALLAILILSIGILLGIWYYKTNK